MRIRPRFLDERRNADCPTRNSSARATTTARFKLSTRSTMNGPLGAWALVKKVKLWS